MVMDLRRPRNRRAARDLVELHSPDEPAVLKQDFENSLCAAFTSSEVAGQLEAAGLEGLDVSEPTDRHLIVAGEFDRAE